MTYELTNDGRGYLLNREALYYDVEGEVRIEVKGLPEGVLYAYITTDARRANVRIDKGAFCLPKTMLRDGEIHMAVSLVKEGIVVKVWTLEPITATSLTATLEGISKIEPQRVYDAEQRLAEQAVKLDTLKQAFEEQRAYTAQLEEKLKKAVEAYNGQVPVIKALHERVTELEANYDPTVIK